MTIRLTAWNAGPSREVARGRWLIYDGGLRCQEALAINLEDIDWAERSIRIQGKGKTSYLPAAPAGNGQVTLELPSPVVRNR